MLKKEAARTADVGTRPQAKREAAVHAERLNAQNPFYNPEYVSPNVQRKRGPVPKGKITSRTPKKPCFPTEIAPEQHHVSSEIEESEESDKEIISIPSKRQKLFQSSTSSDEELGFFSGIDGPSRSTTIKKTSKVQISPNSPISGDEDANHLPEMDNDNISEIDYAGYDGEAEYSYGES